MRKKMILRALGLLLFLAIAFGIREYLLQRRITSGIQRVTIGMTDADVIAIMGKPGSVQPCRGVPKSSKCDYEFDYYPPFEPLNWWTVSFDQSGHVTKKHYWVSP